MFAPHAWINVTFVANKQKGAKAGKIKAAWQEKRQILI